MSIRPSLVRARESRILVALVLLSTTVSCAGPATPEAPARVEEAAEYSAPAGGESEPPPQPPRPSPPPRPAEETANERFCREDRAWLTDGLNGIYDDFKKAGPRASIKRLVALDRRIRYYVESRSSYRPCPMDTEFYDERWAAMGVVISYNVDISYTGLLLQKAHRRDPRSSFRKFTLYSPVFGVRPPWNLGVMPNMDAAYAYAREFPRGPFAKETLLTIANFHKDLFMVLRDERRDYLHDCYKPYVSRAPIAEQRRRAKRVAMQYYDQVLAIDAKNEDAKTFRTEVKNETVRAWSFCAD